MIGVIGGSGVHEIKGIIIKDSKKISTPYGEPSDLYRIGEISGVELVFLPRHGTSHHIAPHKINYRANLWGFKELGAERIISVNAVGGINPDMSPGDIVVLSQIIDMTSGRESTFYDKEEIIHVDFTEPYCLEMRGAIKDAGEKTKIPIKPGATYMCSNGPRLETAAEIRAFSILGSDVIGMTGMPEAVLARELGICFSGIAVITNYAAGISKKTLTTKEVVDTMQASSEKVKKILKEAVSLIPKKRNCRCKDALKDAKM
ncbi:MAG: S-methyl-5'-thioadenosine phosphorylase [Nitrospiraceae bacterium]|nr:S-methyl-5'-thioadenosine phosphorylase [Nitrospiraceae bacterium]